MNNLEEVRRKIAEIQTPRGPDVPTEMPPAKPLQPIEDVDEQLENKLPKGPAGY